MRAPCSQPPSGSGISGRQQRRTNQICSLLPHRLPLPPLQLAHQLHPRSTFSASSHSTSPRTPHSWCSSWRRSSS